jgi:peptidoglycan hydrolase-like protein with peptidoglycan-binding domain
VDGVQGPRTTDAIKQFQEKYGLTVDGVVGPITRSKLLEVYGC